MACGRPSRNGQPIARELGSTETSIKVATATLVAETEPALDIPKGAAIIIGDEATVLYFLE